MPKAQSLFPRRLLSAGQMELNELRNRRMELMKYCGSLKEENFYLKREKNILDLALKKYTDENQEFPNLFKQHDIELQALKRTFLTEKRNAEEKRCQLQIAEEELTKAQDQLVHNRELLDRSKSMPTHKTLVNKLEIKEKEIHTKDEYIERLHLMIGKLNKACRDEINAEKDQHKEKKQELLEVSELLFQARMKLKEKEKEVDMWNLYHHRRNSHVPPIPMLPIKEHTKESLLTARQRAKLYAMKREMEMKKLREAKNEELLKTRRVKTEETLKAEAELPCSIDQQFDGQKHRSEEIEGREVETNLEGDTEKGVLQTGQHGGGRVDEEQVEIDLAERRRKEKERMKETQKRMEEQRRNEEEKRVLEERMLQEQKDMWIRMEEERKQDELERMEKEERMRREEMEMQNRIDMERLDEENRREEDEAAAASAGNEVVVEKRLMTDEEEKLKNKLAAIKESLEREKLEEQRKRPPKPRRRDGAPESRKDVNDLNYFEGSSTLSEHEERLRNQRKEYFFGESVENLHRGIPSKLGNRKSGKVYY